jgi:hypothetical protein
MVIAWSMAAELLLRSWSSLPVRSMLLPDSLPP